MAKVKKSAALIKKRRRIRLLKIRRAVFIHICVLLVAVLVAGSIYIVDRIFGISSSHRDNKQLEKIAAAEIPEWIDVQLIDKGKARSGRGLDRVTDIVVHYVGNPATTAQNNRDYFDQKNTEVCSHFVVGLEGEVIQCVPITERSAASNNRNRDTISIEVCHPDASGKFNEDTYNSLVELVAWLCEICGIDQDNIIRHYDITGKLCPLYYVEHEEAWESFKSDVAEELKEEGD